MDIIEYSINESIRTRKPRVKNECEVFSLSNNNMISDLLDYTGKLFARKGIIFETIQCDTYMKKTSQIKIQNKQFLLYDVSLLETLNDLNLMYLHRASRQDYEKYFSKLACESSYCNEEYFYSFFSLMKYSKNHYSYRDELTNDQKETATRYATIQYLFIIFHEIGHIMLESGFLDKDEQIENMKKIMTRLIEHEVLNVFRSQRGQKDIIYFRENSSLMEELVCDSLSRAFVCKSLWDVYNADDLSAGFFLVYRHIFLVGISDYFADHYHNSAKNRPYTTDILYELLIRETFSKFDIPLCCIKEREGYMGSDFFAEHFSNLHSNKQDDILKTISETQGLLRLISKFYLDVIPNEIVINFFSKINNKCSVFYQNKYDNHLAIIKPMLDELIQELV